MGQFIGLHVHIVFNALWTISVVAFSDNVFSIKSWCKKKFSMEEKTIDKHFGIPEDFDYIDW